ncbi:MAG TPA: cellulose binding domain-containing protein [Bacillota bacterium]
MGSQYIRNGSIPPGATVSFGFNISYSGINAKPTAFTLNGLPAQYSRKSIGRCIKKATTCVFSRWFIHIVLSWQQIRLTPFCSVKHQTLAIRKIALISSTSSGFTVPTLRLPK